MTKKIDEIITNSEKETETLGKKFAEKIRGGMVIYLEGELGSGKTTFVKGIARALDIKTRIISPTFVIIREHEVKSKSHPDIKRLYHLDLYRLTSEKEVLGIDLHGLIRDPNAVTIIEWPEVASNLTIKENWIVKLTRLDESNRKICINPYN